VVAACEEHRFGNNQAPLYTPFAAFAFESRLKLDLKAAYCQLSMTAILDKCFPGKVGTPHQPPPQFQNLHPEKI